MQNGIGPGGKWEINRTQVLEVVGKEKVYKGKENSTGKFVAIREIIAPDANQKQMILS